MNRSLWRRATCGALLLASLAAAPLPAAASDGALTPEEIQSTVNWKAVQSAYGSGELLQGHIGGYTLYKDKKWQFYAEPGYLVLKRGSIDAARLGPLLRALGLSDANAQRLAVQALSQRNRSYTDPFFRVGNSFGQLEITWNEYVKFGSDTAFTKRMRPLFGKNRTVRAVSNLGETGYNSYAGVNAYRDGKLDAVLYMAPQRDIPNFLYVRSAAAQPLIPSLLKANGLPLTKAQWNARLARARADKNGLYEDRARQMTITVLGDGVNVQWMRLR